MSNHEIIDSDSFEVLSVNGDVYMVQARDNFSDAVEDALIDHNGVQIWTLDSSKENSCDLDAGIDVNTRPFFINPPAIVEENSSDNLPAIGHLEEFSVPTAEDGTLLPATVNAKMADGSHQRLTLFPQIVDGHVTYTVQFENDEAVVDVPVVSIPEEPTILEKIDSIISNNEDIISNSRKIRTNRKDLYNETSKVSRYRQRSLIKSKSLLKVNNLRQYQEETAVCESPQVLHVNGKEEQYQETQPPANNSSEYKHAEQFLSLQKYLQSQKLQLKIQPLEPKVQPTKPNIPLLPAKEDSPVVSPLPEKTVEENDGIFIKTSPEYFTKKEKNDHPLGSTENPIQLLQTGKTFHSRQPLSETQLQQISSILRKQKFISSEMPKSMYDPKTNTRIVYRVVFPEDAPLENCEQEKEIPGTKRTVKRARQKSKPTTQTEEEKEKQQKKNNQENIASTVVEPVESPQAPPAKVTKLARTRSGRLSRPPRHMVRDYKRIHNNVDASNRADEEAWYMDYRAPEVDPPTNTSLFSNGLRPRARLKQRNVRPEYRCPSCHKIYLGHARMMWHLRKFPDHSNADEYEEIYQRERCERKARRINLFKLKQMLTGVDRVTLQATYGPFLADAFTLWDFLLLRVRLLKKTGIEEVEGLLKELTLLIDKLGKVAEELLSPVYCKEPESDYQYVELDKHDVAYAMGLPPGVYKVNSDRLDLLHLAEDQQRPPPPRPSQLATKFEPNLSNKLLECSNDSIDLDCSSKDVEPEEEKKDAIDTNSEFLSEFLQSFPKQQTENHIESSADDGLGLWKSRDDVAHVTPPPIWNKDSSPHQLPSAADEELSLWKGGKTVDASEDLQLWKENEVSNWKDGGIHSASSNNIWKDRTDQNAHLWKSSRGESHDDNIWDGSSSEVMHSSSRNQINSEKQWKDKPGSSNVQVQNGVSSDSEMWMKKNAEKNMDWSSGEKDGKKDWMRLWKEEVGAPGLRTGRLTSTPESHGPALFSPPLRRNSVSSFAPTHQEELLSLDLHELFEDLMPEQGKPRQPKPNSIESIINEALFTGNEPPTTRSSIPPSLNIISDSLDEVTNLDFLNQD